MKAPPKLRLVETPEQALEYVVNLDTWEWALVRAKCVGCGHTTMTVHPGFKCDILCEKCNGFCEPTHVARGFVGIKYSQAVRALEAFSDPDREAEPEWQPLLALVRGADSTTAPASS